MVGRGHTLVLRDWSRNYGRARNMSYRLGILLGLGLLACSEGGLESEAPSASFGPQVIAEEAEVAEVELLHDFSVGGEEIALFRTVDDEGHDFVMLRGIRSAQVAEGLVDRLREQEPEITFLELFQTLWPAGAEPSPALVRFHEVQARGFGRADTSARRIQFDKNMVVEKSSASCTTYVNSVAQGTIGTPTPANNNQADMPGGGSLNGILCHAVGGAPACDRLSPDGKVVAVCSDGPQGDISTKPWWRYNGGSWKKDPYYVIRPPGSLVNYWFPRTGTLLKTHVLGIEVVDPPDFLGPAYYVRARDAI